jgi:uncharacterized protein YuzE
VNRWDGPRRYEQQHHKITAWLALTVDHSADAAYLYLNGNEVDRTEQHGRVNIDFDENGDVVGIEILTLDLTPPGGTGC